MPHATAVTQAADRNAELRDLCSRDELQQGNSSHLAPLPLRVVVLAEPFGFGPAAAMAEVFPHLRQRVGFLAFAGAGHTRDIHINLAYDAIHEISNGNEFGEICSHYDAALIACDFPAAEAASAANIHVGIYDPLAWYWPEWPRAVNLAHAYLCQDFFGVRERVANSVHRNIVVTPPLVPACSDTALSRQYSAVINLGGVQNPFLSILDCTSYAQLVLAALHPIASSLYTAVHLITSRSIVAAVDSDYAGARTVSPREAQRLLGSCHIAALTPGLGNIYEAAGLATRVFWLPPVNDSQGQQLAILRQRGLAPFGADWHQILTMNDPIDYFAPQPQVMTAIADALHRASNDPSAKERMRALFILAHETPAVGNSLSSLLDLFGRGGDAAVSDAFVRKVLIPLANMKPG